MKIQKHISAGGIVSKKEGDKTLWLIIQHVEGHWGFPKGHVGDTIVGEKLEEAAIREVREEGGVDARIVKSKPVETYYRFEKEGTDNEKTVYYYLMEYVAGDINHHDDEVVNIEFVEEEQLLEKLTYDLDKTAFQKLTA